MKYRSIDTSPLTKKVFRKLVRQKGNAFLPDQVAEGLANRRYNLTPDVIEEMAGSISPLVATLRSWLEEHGVEPVENSLSTYDRRELMRGANLATLLAYHAFCLYFVENRIDAAEEAIEQGLAWATFVDDHRREAFLYEAMAILYSYVLRIPEEIEAYQKALEAAQRPGDDPEMELMILVAYSSCLTKNYHLDEAMELIDQGIERGKSALSPSYQGLYFPELMLNRARIMVTRNQRRDAIILLEEALKLALSVDKNHQSLDGIYYHLGQTYHYLGEQEKFLEIHLKSIEIAERNENSMAIIWAYLQLGLAYIDINQLDLAEKALDIAEASALKSSFPQLEYIYNGRLLLFKLRKQFDEAIEYARKIEELHEGGRISKILAANEFHLGEIYCLKGDTEQGKKAYRRSLAIIRELGEIVQSERVWLALAHLLMEEGRLEEAEETIEEFVSLINEEEMKGLDLAKIHDLRGKIAEKKGDMAEALACTRRSSELMNGHYQRELEESLQNARALADCELYRKEAEIQELQRKKAEKSLAEALAAFEDKRYALASVESQLRETLALLDRAQAREIVGVLKQAIDNIEGTIDRTDTSLHYLQTLDPEFFKRLREQYPGLTRKQEHYCGLIRAGLSSKEIASTLNLSTEGIRSQRKRIRKRLGLDANDSLESVIGGL